MRQCHTEILILPEYLIYCVICSFRILGLHQHCTSEIRQEKMVGLFLAENQESKVCQVKEMVWSLLNFGGSCIHINLPLMTLIYSKLYEVFLEYKIRRVLQKTQ